MLAFETEDCCFLLAFHVFELEPSECKISRGSVSVLNINDISGIRRSASQAKPEAKSTCRPFKIVFSGKSCDHEPEGLQISQSKIALSFTKHV